MPETQKSEIVLGLVGGIAVVGLVAYLQTQNKGGGSSGYQVIGPDDAETTAALSAQASADSAQYALAATQSNNATTALGDYLSQTDGLTAALAATQAGVQQAQINATSQTQINQATDNAQVQIAGYQANSEINVAGIEGQSADKIAGIQGATATSVAQSQAASNIGVAQGADNAAVTIAGYNANASTAIAADQANSNAQVAASQATAAKNANPGNSTGGIIGAITGGLGSLLGWL